MKDISKKRFIRIVLIFIFIFSFTPTLDILASGIDNSNKRVEESNRDINNISGLRNVLKRINLNAYEDTKRVDIDDPVINVNLESESSVTIREDDEFNIQYSIQPQPFESEGYNSQKKELIIVIDISDSNTGNGQIYKKLFGERNEDGFIYSEIIRPLMEDNNLSVGLVTFNDKGVYSKLPLTNEEGKVSNFIRNVKGTGETVGVIDNALIRADEMLNNNNDATKNILIISLGDIVYNANNISSIKDKKYNIFTLAMKNGSNILDNINKFFNGEIINKYYSNAGNTPMQGELHDIGEKLKENIVYTFTVKDAVVKFDLGEKLQIENGSLTHEGGNIYSFAVDEIRYTSLTKSKQYTAESPQGIEFTVKPKNGSKGTISFTDDNSYIQYTKINGNLSEKQLIETPIINILDDLEIEAELIGSVPSFPNVNEEITVTYKISPQSFTKENVGEIIVSDAKLEFNLGEKFNVIDGLEKDVSGIYILDLGNINYRFENDEYIADEFNVDFKIASVKSGNNISFKLGTMKYTNILATSPEIITKEVEVPAINVNEIQQSPEVTEPDLRILEIQPADSFTITTKEMGNYIQTGREEKVINHEGKSIKVLIDHISMPEFIGSLYELNGSYDVIVLGNYKDEVNINKGNSNTKNQLAYQDYRPLTDAANINTTNPNLSSVSNDITDRKTKEIKEFIQSGQLVFFDNSLSNINKNTKMYKSFVNVTGSNLLKYGSGDSRKNSISLNEIIEKYMNIDSRYKGFNISVSPLITDTNDMVLGNPDNRTMKFNIAVNNKLGSNVEEIVDIKLYLDINGDGLFKNNEIVYTIENVNVPTTNYTFNYQMTDDFIGYLEWKIEVTKKNSVNSEVPIESSYTDDILFRRLGKEKEINVLQITPYSHENNLDPDNDTHDRNFNMATNKLFQEVLSELKDYEFNITVISVDDFNKNLHTLNSVYDMIVVGFGDGFQDLDNSNKSVNKSFNLNAINLIKSYVNTGQSLMLTHDTINSYNSTNTGLLELAGQRKGYTLSLNATESSKNPGWVALPIQGKRVYEINSALITEYPFNLSNELDEGEFLAIRRTHKQWSQLDLEKEVIPWYTLVPNTVNSSTSCLDNNNKYKNNNVVDDDNDKNLGDTSYINPYDVRNNYYTYSIGNVTFSGTGENTWESKTPYPITEMKLFANTIVKAERSANHAPTIEVINLDDGKKISSYQEGFTFQVRANDIDRDKVNINIDVYGVMESKELVKIKTVSFEGQDSGTTNSIILNKDEYEDYKELKVVFNASDSKKASAKTVERKVNIIDSALLSIGMRPDESGYLIGDNVNVSATVGSSSQTSYSGITMNLNNYDRSALQLINNSIINFSNIKNGSPQSQNNNYTFKLLTNKIISINDIVNYDIKSQYNYKIEDETSQTISDSTSTAISVKRGQITIKIIDDSGNTIPIWVDFKLSNCTTGYTYTGAMPESKQGTLVIEDPMSTGRYSIDVSPIDGYDVITSNTVDLNFENPLGTIEVVLMAQVSDIKHGLYQGLGSEGNVDILENLDGQDGFEVISGMNVNYGSSFTLGGNSAVINLAIDSKLGTTDIDETNKNNIKVYQVINNNGKTELTEYKKESLMIQRTDSKYKIKINDTVERDTKILVTYSAKLPESSTKKEFSNNISISNKSKSIKVYIKGTERNTIYLPDLF